MSVFYYMKLNMHNMISIICILIIFSLLYYLFLKKRFYKEYNLILNRSYLEILFEPSKNLIEASQGTNGDISVEIVDFEECDFHFPKELKKISQFFDESADKEHE